MSIFEKFDIADVVYTKLESFNGLSKGQITAFNNLKAKFDNFSDTNVSTLKVGAPAELKLIGDPVPYRVHTSRPVPIHLKAEALKAIEQNIKEGVIERVSPGHSSPWCLQGFFVPKAGSEKLRLVTDFTPLNAHVLRPIHPFEAANDIKNSKGNST